MNIKIIWAFGCLVLVVSVIIILINLSPHPVVAIAKKTMFRIPEDTRNKEYAVGNVNVFVNEVYKSNYQNNQFDIYLPNQPLEGKPVIAWVHGGGFVGGDKLEVKEYATKLAQEGYTVAVMNYELVPKTSYPIPVIQTAEFIKHLKENVEVYSINADNLFIAGDSAGAQIASQFVTTQTNESYGRILEIDPVLKKGAIKGTLLYCGVYDLPDVVNNYEFEPVKFIFHKIGWGYAKEKKWLLLEKAQHSIVLNFTTNDFPPTYITDGNTLSFESQGKRLAENLKAHNVSVRERFFKRSEFKTAHEYQFQLEKEPGKIAFKDTLEFLETHRKN